jgi:hypothetical protein
MTRSSALFILTVLLLGFAPPVAAQIPVDKYLKYVPLTYPRIIRQTDATEGFRLYGDPSDPSYRDVDPKDGVDDARARWLRTAARRFAPIMVRNTPQFPTDFRTFYNRTTFPIYRERWDVTRSEFALIESEQIDLAKLAGNPCPSRGANSSDDCRLLTLLETFGPNRRPIEPEAVSRAEQESFTVLHLDMPGFNEKTWKQNYWPSGAGPKRPDLAGSERVFAHPFIAEVPSRPGAQPAYEFVIQYWFFYPANDGPNNHEGDWEHINVVIAPLSSVGQPFDRQGIERLLDGRMPLDGADPLVLRRIEYYLHHFVYSMDFTSPSAYQPRAAWDKEVEALARARKVSRKPWDRVRARAWRDAAETAINTRPVVWIGGDAAGVQNVLEMPGLKDQDGHASYPFRGYYKKIGPGGVGERVIEPFDHFEYFAAATSPSPSVEDFGDDAKIALLPDWERLLDPVMTDPEARRQWAWALLPLRFGFPASPSPGAGLIAHADMGNVAPIGPAFNNAWNRLGDSVGYEHYEIVEESWATPMGMTDSFFPRLGFLNAPILYFMLKPPLDLAWRTIALPVRAVTGSRQPTFLPANAPAVRNVSLETGPMLTDLNDDLSALFFTREQFPEILVRILSELPADPGTLGYTTKFGWATTPIYALTFHLSPRISAESSFINYRAQVGFDITGSNMPEPIATRADFYQFEFHGAARFNLRTGAFQPYVKYGHGLTWYQLQNTTVNGVPLQTPNSPKFKPDGHWWDFGFNETILGGGVDWSNIRVGNAWIGAKASYTWIYHKLGFERLADVEEFPFIATAVAGQQYSVWRQQVRLLLTVGF